MAGKLGESGAPEGPELREYDGLPRGLLACSARELYDRLGGPSLIHLAGAAEPAVFVSVLLHGNETTGWEAVRSVLAELDGARPPRSLLLFIGNVAAAREGERRLPGQADYNRIWRGSGGAEQRMAAQVLERASERGLFASLDIHNNSGRNPHYACINRLDHRYLHLATLFSRTVVYFRRPDTVQSMAFAGIAPAVTVECGKPDQPHGVEHAAEFLRAVLHLSAIPAHPVPSHDYDLFHTVATVTVPDGVPFGFREGDLILREDLDRLNFTELPPGTGLGRVAPGVASVEAVLDARDEADRQVAARFFYLDGQALRTRVACMPSMLTRDPEIIRLDCLCYLMERLPPLDP